MKAKILFDGNCIICDSEVAHYYRLAPDKFELVDISAPEFNAGNFNLTPEAVERSMHVITPDGKLAIGVDAFAYIWSCIEKYNWAARCIQFPLVKAPAKLGYRIFASVRKYLPKKKPLG